VGKVPRDFQDTEYLLNLFGKKVSAARKGYRAYLAKGVGQGRRPDLVGGGLIRSAGGWSVVKAMRRAQSRMKGDERILGDGEFAQSVLDAAKEKYEDRYHLQTQGHDLDTVAQRVSALLGINPEQVWASGKHPLTVKARSLLCYWAVRELGFTATEVSKQLRVSQPAVSISVKRGEKIIMSEKLKLICD